MSRIIKRVACAIAPAGTPVNELDKRGYTYMACAAIAAMREPTKEMIDALPEGPFDVDTTDEAVTFIWQAMIDAALRMPETET